MFKKNRGVRQAREGAPTKYLRVGAESPKGPARPLERKNEIKNNVRQQTQSNYCMRFINDV